MTRKNTKKKSIRKKSRPRQRKKLIGGRVKQKCSRGKFDMQPSADQFYEDDDCITLSGNVKEGGQSVIKIGKGHVLRQTLNDEWDDYLTVQQLVENCINPHFIKMYSQRECRNSKKYFNGYKYHQVLEQFDGDLSNLPEEYRQMVNVQLYTTIYSLVNHRMILLDRKPENVFYSVGDYVLHYEIDNSYYAYETNVFIVHGDYMIRNDCGECDENTLITSIPSLTKSINAILNLCYDRRPNMSDMTNGINRFLDDCECELPIGKLTVKMFLKILKKRLKKMLKGSEDEEDKSVVYWEIDKGL